VTRITRRLALASACALVAASAASCGGDGSSPGSGTDGSTTAAAGAPNEGPPDTLFQNDVVNAIEEGHYFLTAEAEGVTELVFLLSFAEAMHVELILKGGNVDTVRGSPVDDEQTTFEFDSVTRRSAAHDFSAGNYRVLFVAKDVDGEFRVDLEAAPLVGSEL